MSMRAARQSVGSAMGETGETGGPILTSENNEYLDMIMSNLIKGNENYLATHKQATGLISMLMYKCLEKKPVDGRRLMKRILLNKNLKYHLNKYMLRNGYKRSPGQMEHEEQFLQKSAEAHIRCRYEDQYNFKPSLEGGKFSLTPYGPPLAPKRRTFKNTYPACVAHGLIPYYVRTRDDQKIFVAREQSAWPSLFF